MNRYHLNAHYCSSRVCWCVCVEKGIYRAGLRDVWGEPIKPRWNHCPLAATVSPLNPALMWAERGTADTAGHCL